MTAQELLNIARKEKPMVRYAVNDKKNTIGAWDEKLGRFVPVASLGIDGKWYSVPGEILVNGEPIRREWFEEDKDNA